MRKLTALIVLFLTIGLVCGCGEKKEEAAADKPAEAKPAETQMVKDVICNMDVDPSTATIISEYEGKKYYFCSEQCKEEFEANPVQ
jgi:YHS domain-containing protein